VTQSNDSPIVAHELSKSYGDFVALDHLSLEVGDREILGLLGPNGAGKSTFIRLLLGAIRPTAGWASINGLNCYRQRDQVHRRVSYLPGDARLYRRMRGSEVLRFFARMRGQSNQQRGLELADRLELDVTRRVAAMSTGMRQKLAIAATLAADTPILILDEPTANLDPTVRSEVLQIVREAREAGATVLFSSHVLSEIEELCDRVVILRRGQMVFHQDMSQLRQRHRLVAHTQASLPPLPAALAEQATLNSHPDGSFVIETEQDLGSVLRWVSTLELQDVRIEPLGLGRIYAQWDGRQDKTSESGAVAVDGPTTEPSKTAE